MHQSQNEALEQNFKISNKSSKKRGIINSDSDEYNLEINDTNKEANVNNTTDTNSKKKEKKPVTKKIRVPKEPKKEKKKSLSADEIESLAFETINHMKDCYRKDTQANLERKPALCKIDNVEVICSKIVKKEAQEAFIKLGVLKEIKFWLEPLQDCSLPSPKVKKCLLDLLFNMKIHRIDLENSGIGKIVHFYSKNAKESKEVRRMAYNLVKKWKAMIIREEIDD